MLTCCSKTHHQHSNFVFFNHTPTTEIYTLSLHDALPILYAALAQAPAGTFTGGLSLSFCVDLDLKKPLCKAANLDYTPRSDGEGVTLIPPPKALVAPWEI